ncbi:unnamed protein product [Didymodactylos carnosus]|uniref:Kelch repeat-containing protein n=1 Tax=Didymodactylos carnosus TaxID=1234261 RepID=A0A814ANE9_9BILA|nr:unnamed protein product [Didymodactylos carnosus]CAF0917881.1 unnamed protein product [Didymodactylos carnosus]CAF3552074.1 unnamed protein product [Didymodactylos carnosus]CAF3697752.1 unnamed protein product [Didymodactylos carnosus]
MLQSSDNTRRIQQSSKNMMQFTEIYPINEQLGPSPRSGHRAVATDSDLWLWGGYFPRQTNQNESMFRELWRYNFALKQWTKEETIGDGPTLTLASHAVCLHQHLMFVFGGTGFPFGQHGSNDLYILDLRQRKWKRHKLLTDPPGKVYGASMLIKNEYLYILCGTNSLRYNSDVYQIHLPTMQSIKIGHTFDEIEEPFEAGRYRQEAVLHNDKIFVFGGGGILGISFSLKLIPIFDLNTHTWSFLKTIPDPVHSYPSERKFHSVFKISENRLLVFGGAHFDIQQNQHFLVEKNVWSFDFNKLEWTKLPIQMITSTYFHAAAMNQRGEIWSHGGVLLTDNDQDGDELTREKRISNLFMFHVRPLSLQEIAWSNFVTKITDKSLLTKRSSLLELMIPLQFVNRIH